MKASCAPVGSNVMALAPGHKLLWYEIEAVLGRGGFGIVYLAWDTNLQTRVAIKEFLPAYVENQRRGDIALTAAPGCEQLFHRGLENFLNEARTLFRFKHPGIVPVHTAFKANNTAYMVMDFLQGRDLEDAFKFKKVESEFEFKRIMAALLDVLELLHCQDFVHRDLTPRNIFLQDNGEPVLLDFGSSRWTPIQKLRPLTTLISPGYAAHEQYTNVLGKDGQGPWTDIYSLGAMLYRGISGKAPIDSVSRAHALLNGGDCLKPAREVGKGRFSSNFLAAVDWALEMRPRARPRTVGQWKNALLADDERAAGPRPRLDAKLNPGADFSRPTKIQEGRNCSDTCALTTGRCFAEPSISGALDLPESGTDVLTKINSQLLAHRPERGQSRAAEFDAAPPRIENNFQQTVKEQVT